MEKAWLNSTGCTCLCGRWECSLSCWTPMVGELETENESGNSKWYFHSFYWMSNFLLLVFLLWDKVSGWVVSLVYIIHSFRCACSRFSTVCRQNTWQSHQYISAALCQAGGTKQPWTWLNKLLKLAVWPLRAFGILQNRCRALLMCQALNHLRGMKYCCMTVPWRSSQNCIHLVSAPVNLCWYVPH